MRAQVSKPLMPGQPDVEQHEVEARPLRACSRRLLARLGAGGSVAMVGQQVHQRPGDARVVVDDEYS